MSSSFSRRDFVSRSVMALGAGFLGLKRYERAARAAESSPGIPSVDRYGALQPDPHRIIDLPDGFRYRVLSRTGEAMSDGLIVPGFPDGMGAFEVDGKIVLIRNHELESKGKPGQAEIFRRVGPFGEDNELFPDVDRDRLYDAGDNDGYPSLGGTTTLVLDPDTLDVEAQFLSLAGTERNCAGGVSPWGTWITCEESNETAGRGFREDHGYAFDVKPTVVPQLQSPVAFKDMGRFRREAVAVDPRTGIVYQTEDRPDGLFYRFIPNVRGQLERGGRLQALAISGRHAADTRNWVESNGPVLPPGAEVDVWWQDLKEVRAPLDDLRYRGHSDGAAIFARGEGAWFGDGGCYFACTNGGRAKLGQIFKYTPSPLEGEDGEEQTPGKLELYLESENGNVLQGADNLTLAPWGDLIICEDRSEASHLRGVTPDGRIYTFGHNARSGTEFAGACFAPNRSTLFVNIQKPGITLAIDGPWQQS